MTVSAWVILMSNIKTIGFLGSRCLHHTLIFSKRRYFWDCPILQFSDSGHLLYWILACSNFKCRAGPGGQESKMHHSLWSANATEHYSSTHTDYFNNTMSAQLNDIVLYAVAAKRCNYIIRLSNVFILSSRQPKSPPSTKWVFFLRQPPFGVFSLKYHRKLVASLKWGPTV